MPHRPMTLRQQITSQLSLALAGLFVAVPLLWLLRLAFDATITAKPRDAALIPHEWTLANFVRAWETPISNYSFAHLLGNSLLVAGSAVNARELDGSLTPLGSTGVADSVATDPTSSTASPRAAGASAPANTNPATHHPTP